MSGQEFPLSNPIFVKEDFGWPEPKTVTEKQNNDNIRNLLQTYLVIDFPL